MKSSRRIKDSDYEDHGVVVKDINEYNRRMEIIQSRIATAEMLGIGTSEYEKRAARPVHLGAGLVIGSEDDKTQIRIHTIRQTKGHEGNTVVWLDMDIWEKREEKK